MRLEELENKVPSMHGKRWQLLQHVQQFFWILPLLVKDVGNFLQCLRVLHHALVASWKYGGVSRVNNATIL
jgi:hypothetical protein